MSAIGPYEVVGVIGSGGFGTVYLCTDPADGARVAAKVLDRGSTSDPGFLARLRDEAAAMRQVDDENCVRVRDVVINGDLAAIVTDFIDGASLRTVLDRHGRLTGPQALDVLRGALRGLVAVHRVGLLHGDVKPDNVLVDRHGTSRLIDFGLAAAPPVVSRDNAPLTGSPGYLSPERIRGERPDVRSDVYACAVLLFELLTGRRPYGGADTHSVLAAHLNAPVPDPRAADPTISAEFASLCMRGMAKDPQLRPRSAAAFLGELEDAARREYGAAWRTGLGVGALVGGLVAVGAAQARAAEQVATTRTAARVALGGGRRIGTRAALATGGVVLIGAAVVVVLTTRGHPTEHPGAFTGRLLVKTSSTAWPYRLLDTRGRVAAPVLRPDVLCCTAAVLSPDGTRLVLQEENGLLVQPVGGTARPLLPTEVLDVGSIAWSPDGARIAFSTLEAAPVPQSDVDVVNADGSGLRVLAHGLNVHSIAWSPDERQLAFAQNQGGIWIVSTTGGARRQILPGPASAQMLPDDLSWAPSGRLLFYQEGVLPNGVWRISPSGSGLRAVLAQATSPSWAPDAANFAAVLHGRVVLVNPTGRILRRVGPSGVSAVQWAGSG